MGNNQNQTKCIGVLTSGGDAPGMNAAVRAVVRTAIKKGAKVFVIKEGYEGLVNDGKDGKVLIEKAGWDYVSGISGKGGTIVGTSRCEEFLHESGRLKAARNLVKWGIDRLVVIGGDGSLTGADILHKEWPNLMGSLSEGPDDEKIKQKAALHTQLAVVGLVGTIDNDMVDTEMTIGADTALHRISYAVDAINSTAASHQRIFVVKVMGRHCGYLALMGALITGADWVLIPERPSRKVDWKSEMTAELQKGREAKRAIIVILAEGTMDRAGKEIKSEHVKKALEEGLEKDKDGRPPDVRVTILGHVQRGGSPSAYDRILSARLGYAAVTRILKEEAFEEPVILGVKGNTIKPLPLIKTVEKNDGIAEALKGRDYKTALAGRGQWFRRCNKMARLLMKPEVKVPDDGDDIPQFAVLHAGAPAPGMNAAVRVAVRLAIDNNCRMLGIKRGFEGLIEGNDHIELLDWSYVNGWASMGGAKLGVSRKIPGNQDFVEIINNIRDHKIHGLLIIGGWNAYEGAYELRKGIETLQESCIPIVCVPASINNNLPGSEASIGADTALNTIVEALDKIKESAVEAKRCFIVEVMGRYCGYLALMSGLAVGADRVYLHEETVALRNLQDDLRRLLREFKRDRPSALIIRNENAYRSYDTRFMTALFDQEGKKDFDARQVILGHLQQGGPPSPFDRILATRLARFAVMHLIEGPRRGKPESAFFGWQGGRITCTDLDRFEEMVKKEFQRPEEQWWMSLRTIASTLARR